MKNTIIISILFVSLTVYGQTSEKLIDYKKADSVALSFPRNKYYFYQETVQDFAEQFTTEREKCRAIFRWITNNIKFDWSVKNDYKKDRTDPLIVYKTKKAVRAGYASLFKAMCEEAKIKCEYISGESITSNNYGSHAWNIVKLDGVWYIMDVTWATGNTTDKLSSIKNTKIIDETWWMANYNEFIKSHKTDDSNWKYYIENKD